MLHHNNVNYETYKSAGINLGLLHQTKERLL